MFEQSFLEHAKGAIDIVGELEQMQVFWRNGPMPDQRLEIDHLFPEIRTVEHDDDFLIQLAGLDEGKDFHEFIERAVAARKNHHRLREISEPEFPHEEVV